MAAEPDIGTRIRKRRQELRLTQEELASRVGVHPSSVGNWEKGKHFPQRYQGAVEAVLGIILDEPEPEVPESLRREVASLTPRQRDWMVRWLTEESRRQRGEDNEPAQAPPEG